jgi:hypothetical protein
MGEFMKRQPNGKQENHPHASLGNKSPKELAAINCGKHSRAIA